jgi:AraC-like DNA-binding protein
LKVAKENNKVHTEINTLSGLSKLFFEINEIDSALYYIDLSNKIASKNKSLKNLATNNLILSEIEKSKGRYKSALQFYETHSKLKDSIHNGAILGEINQQQRLYEVSKTNQQIEELIIDRQVKERTIYYQKIVFAALVIIIIVLIGMVYQYRNLRIAQKVLFQKNVEIIKIEDHSSEKEKKNTNTDYDELMNKILTVMKDPAIYCDASLTVDKLASLTQSNHNYVATAIKTSFNKNFRSFVNEYRIKEAQRIFMDPDFSKFTIDSIFEKVGFNSRSVFYNAFKEITGVSPNFYLKSMQKQYV